MTDAPERIFICEHVGEYGQYFPEAAEAEGEYGGTAVAYIPERAPSPAAVTVDREAIEDIIDKAQIKVVYGRAWVRDPEEVAEKIIATLTPAPVSSELEKTIHLKMQEIAPLVPEGWDYTEWEYLPISKPRPTGTASWIVKTPDGSELIISNTDKESVLALTPAPVAGNTDPMTIAKYDDELRKAQTDAVQEAARITIAEAIDALKQCKTPATCTEFLQRNIGIENGIAALRALEGGE